MEQATLQSLTADIASAFVSNNPIAPGEVAGLITTIGTSLAAAVTPPPPEPVFEPAINPRNSVHGDHIISLIDGRPYAMLKRHIARHGLTPDEYRARYGLPASYPMTAPNYSERRRKLAKDIGLGRIGNPRRGRRKAAA